MIIRSTKTNGKPLILHAPGGYIGRRKYRRYNRIFFMVREQLAKLEPEPVNVERLNKNLTILTCSNYKRPGCLDQSLARLGLRAEQLGKDIQTWRNIEKIKLYRDALDEVTTPYVMGLDSDDVIVLRDPYEAVVKFQEMDCEMLFNAELTFYPDFEYDRDGKPYVTEQWKSFQQSLATTQWSYLNAGCFIANTTFFRKFIARGEELDNGELVDSGQLPLQPSGFHQKSTDSEQILVHRLFNEFHPQVELDREHQVFLNTIHVPPGPHYVRLYRKWSQVSLSDCLALLLSYLPLPQLALKIKTLKKRYERSRDYA